MIKIKTFLDTIQNNKGDEGGEGEQAEVYENQEELLIEVREMLMINCIHKKIIFMLKLTDD